MVLHQPDNSLGNFSYGWHFYEDAVWSAHFHRNLEAVYVVEGEVELTVAGRTYMLQAGQWSVILSNQIHSFSSVNHHKLWIAMFSEDHVNQFAFLTADRQSDAPVFTCPDSIQRFLEEQLIGKEPELMLRKACLYALCSCFLSAGALTKRDTKNERRLEELLEYVASHYAEDLTLHTLADRFGYEYHYLSRLLHKNYRISFRDLLNQYRVDEALRLLRSTELTVGSIAERCGFSSVRSFNHVFHQMTGRSPRQERNGKGE